MHAGASLSNRSGARQREGAAASRKQRGTGPFALHLEQMHARRGFGSHSLPRNSSRVRSASRTARPGNHRRRGRLHQRLRLSTKSSATGGGINKDTHTSHCLMPYQLASKALCTMCCSMMIQSMNGWRYTGRTGAPPDVLGGAHVRCAARAIWLRRMLGFILISS